jgi:hypothetical protein
MRKQWMRTTRATAAAVEIEVLAEIENTFTFS